MTDSASKTTSIVIKDRPQLGANARPTHQRNNPRSPWNRGPMCGTDTAWKSYRAYLQNGLAKRGLA